jgi:predicted MPP superfamily phosphohydrolase
MLKLNMNKNKNNFDNISDLHTDIWFKNNKINQKKFNHFYKNNLSNENFVESEIIILAGDTGNYNSMSIEFIKYLKDKYRYIILVGGNHEYYLFNENQSKKYGHNSFNRYEEFRNLCNDLEGVFYLESDMIELNGIKFAGNGLWYDYSLGLIDYKMSIEEIIEFKSLNKNDHTTIHTDFYGFYREYGMYGSSGKTMRVKHIDDILLAKEKHDSFLELVSKEKPQVMVSHICPDKKGLFSDYEINEKGYDKIESEKENIFNYVDTSKFDEYIDGKIWIYGHTHKKTDFISRGCRFVSNPMGYPHEKLKNKISKIII